MHDQVFIGRAKTLNVMEVCNGERLFWNLLAKHTGAHHDNMFVKIKGVNQILREFEDQLL